MGRMDGGRVCAVWPMDRAWMRVEGRIIVIIIHCRFLMFLEALARSEVWTGFQSRVPTPEKGRLLLTFQ